MIGFMSEIIEMITQNNKTERYPFFKQTSLFQFISKFSCLIDTNLSTKNLLKKHHHANSRESILLKFILSSDNADKKLLVDI